MILRISYFALFVIGFSLFFGANSAFADVTITAAPGSGAPGCEETSQGCYSPSTVTVSVGETVIFSNTDSAAHTFTSGDSTMPETVGVLFDSSLVMAGSTYEWSPSSAGTVPYFCIVHPWMQGLIIVQSSNNIPEPTSTISVRTDKSSYKEGDTIKISGQVTNPKSGIAVNLIVKSPNGNLVAIDVLSVSSGNTFSTTMSAGGSLMKDAGTYQFVTQYGTENVSDSGSFYFSGSTVTPPTFDSGKISVSGSGGVQSVVSYSITGGNLQNIVQDMSANALIVAISSTSDGSITLTLPRTLIDSKTSNGNDDDFFVLIDGEEIDFDEKTTSSTRVVTISFPAGAKDIEIIGTKLGSYESSPTPSQSYPSSAPYGTDVTIPRDTGAPGCENYNSCYSPYKITVDEGETITWYNADSAAHTVTGGSPNGGPSGVFDSSMLMAGNSFSHKFNSPGIYDYFCMVHPWMEGVVSISKPYTPPTNTPPTSDSGKISVSGTSVSYSITGGKLQSIIPDISAFLLIVSIDATSDGSVTLTLPRTLIDAKTSNGNDDDFFVLVDGEEINFNEKKMSSSRILTIAFPTGAENLEIIGTKVIGTPSSYTPPVTVPPGMNIVIPSGTGAPGCENSNSCYEPRTFIAGKGSTITWFNSDSAAHTVTSGNPGKGPTGEFDSGLFMSGKSFSHKFNKDGTYPYFCMVHPWMEGKVSIQRGGMIFGAPTPSPAPSPTPTPTMGSISVSVNDYQYSPSDLVTVKVTTSTSANVAVSVIGPGGDSIVSRSVSTDSRGNGSLQFKLPDSSVDGSYKVNTSATISKNNVSDSTTFTVKSSVAKINIITLQPTDQQGNAVSSFTAGKLGFVKVGLSSSSTINSLVTINLFDSDLTSLGIGSFQTNLSSGTSEMTLSFFIPNGAELGNGNIYANVFSDWPSKGGVPLTGESSTQVRIQ